MGNFSPEERKELRHGAKREGRLHPLALAVLVALTGVALLGGCSSQPVKEKAVAEGSVAEAKSAYMREDYGTAAGMLEGPAMKGDPEAQYALGYMYYYGKGVPRDRNRARSWFEESARAGNEDAKRALALLGAYGQLPPLSNTPPRPEANVGQPTEKPADKPAPAPADPTRPGAVPGSSSAAPAGGQNQSTASSAAATGFTARGAARYKSQAEPVEELVAAPAVQAVKVTTAHVSEAAMMEPEEKPSSVRTDASPANGKADGSYVQKESQVTPAPNHVSRATYQGTEPAGTQPNPGAEGAQADSGANPSLSEPAGGTGGAPEGEESSVSSSKDESQPSESGYTVYLISSPDKSDLVRLVRRHDLSRAVSYYRMREENGMRYHMIYGRYPTLTAARKALRKLPKTINKNRPWINDYPRAVKLVRLN